MKVFLIRHGKDDESVRGGWSGSPLTEDGIVQIKELAGDLARRRESLGITRLFSSDLKRAAQTAEIIAPALQLEIEYLPEFRETNNGLLAGMKNDEALIKYPGLFWSALAWDEHYPEGESPHEFYVRISKAWRDLKSAAKESGGNVILVTHGGVINVIQCIEHGIDYSNKANPFPIGNAEMIGISI